MRRSSVFISACDFIICLAMISALLLRFCGIFVSAASTYSSKFQRLSSLWVSLGTHLCCHHKARIAFTIKIDIKRHSCLLRSGWNRCWTEIKVLWKVQDATWSICGLQRPPRRNTDQTGRNIADMVESSFKACTAWKVARGEKGRDQRFDRD